MKYRWGIFSLLLSLIPDSLDTERKQKTETGSLSAQLGFQLSRSRVLLSTIYDSYDGMSGQLIGCQEITKKRYGTTSLRLLLKRGVPIVASRGKKRGGIPCGSKLIIFNPRTKRFGIGIKLDTGPYSCYYKNDMIISHSCLIPWQRKSSLDISRSLANHLGHSGLEYVYIWKIEEE